MTRVTIDLTFSPPTVRNPYDESVRDILREHGARWVPAERCWVHPDVSGCDTAKLMKQLNAARDRSK